MRYLILSDIHSNEEAFSAVLARVRRRKYDRVVILGDFVGYGADPNAVIEKVTRMRKQKAMIRGNHDKVVCGLDSGDLFNPMALTAARWTTERLSGASRRFLEGLPVGPIEVDGAFVICHGSPRDEDAYIFSDYDAYLNFTFSDASVCFFGHSHIPSLFTLQPHGIRVDVIRGGRERIRLQRDCRYLINPGSIGQPRDRNPDAAFAFYDTADRTVTFERVRYDVEKARDKIHRAGLPGMLGDRLMIGA